jgi:asparagine synthase (glutamine-hydrolysing)
MTDVIAHRGPDGEGHWVNDEQTLGFGHRRLSIIDLSSRGSQPMEFKSLVITYNGEIYNYLELKSELLKVGYTFISDSDTEVILAAYDFWGVDCVSRFNGMWSFVIYDKKSNELFCSRDRFGIKPFYYYQNDDLLYFASEIKQFTVIPGWSAKINKTKVFDFIQNSLINHTSETLFEHVFELRGGHNLLAVPGSKDFRILRYYNPADSIHQVNSASEAEQIRDFKNLMTDAVKLALRSDVKVGSALSGGIDSSMIASVSSEILESAGKSNNQQCVSACFTEDKIDESFYIDALSEYADIKVHKVFPDFSDFLNSDIIHKDFG